MTDKQKTFEVKLEKVMLENFFVSMIKADITDGEIFKLTRNFVDENEKQSNVKITNVTDVYFWAKEYRDSY